MVVLQNIVLKKANPYLKYLLNHKNSQKNHMARGQTYTLQQ